MMNVLVTASKIYRKDDSKVFKTTDLHQGMNLIELLHYFDPINEEPLPISQTIAETMILFATSVKDIEAGNAKSDIKWDKPKECFFFEEHVPEEWRKCGVITDKVGSYRATIAGTRINISAYDKLNRAIYSQIDYPKQLQKMMPIIGALLAQDYVVDDKFAKLLNTYIEQPNDFVFAEVYQYFFMKHEKDDEYIVTYMNIPYGPYEDFESLALNLRSVEIEAEELKHKDEKAKIIEGTYKFQKKDFKKEYWNLIPKFGPEYVFPEKLAAMSGAITDGDITSVLFTGPAGTGKTMSCKLIAELIGLPLMDVVNCTDNLDEFILGKYVPEGTQIVFKESYVTKAIRDGGAVVFEEINFAKPQYLAFLNSLLDDNGFVRLDNGEVVRRNKNFRFFATMNIGYFGTKELNQALYNRFQAIVEINELSDDAIKTMLTERVPECAGIVNEAISLYHRIKDKIEREELDAVISPRNLENWMKLCKHEPMDEAAEKTIIPIAKGDKDLELDLRLLLKQNHWD